ncbi:MAG: LytTR family DNA-binding domain-containing protein [Bacteroidales bacterium]|nr:LytTR family DNA-binding domain-containing protein [Bacteroidales bacterium]
MKSVKTLIIDDEKNCQAALSELVNRFCPELEILGMASSVKTGIALINKIKPDLVFLDIKMPDGDGFKVLQNVEYNNFEVIFTTAHKEYALKAFDFSAIHYLLKPIDHNALKNAVRKFIEFDKKHYNRSKKIELIKENAVSGYKKIIFPVTEGFEIYDTSDIIRLEADGSYTSIYFKDVEKPVIVSHLIGHYEELLGDLFFVRVHKSHLINLNFVSKYIKSDGGYLLMSDGAEITISERKKSDFQQRLRKFARGL